MGKNTPARQEFIVKNLRIEKDVLERDQDPEEQEEQQEETV